MAQASLKLNESLKGVQLSLDRTFLIKVPHSLSKETTDRHSAIVHQAPFQGLSHSKDYRCELTYPSSVEISTQSSNSEVHEDLSVFSE